MKSKTLFLVIVALVVLAFGIAEVTAISSEESAANDILNKNNTDSNVLVVYFSRTGDNYNVGNVEVGNLYRTKENGKEFFTDEYKYDKWLTPERYYKSDYNNEHIFLLVSQEQLTNNETKTIIQKGKKVYSDEYYIVYDYPSHKAFKESF